MNIENIFKKASAEGWQNDVFILWQLSKPHMWRLVAAILGSFIISGINGGIAWLIKPVLDSIFVEKSKTFLFFLPFGILTLFLMKGIFTYLTNYLMSSIGAKITKALRQGVYDKLLGQE